jgi:DNA-binding MarR family transcriptional regulator
VRKIDASAACVKVGMGHYGVPIRPLSAAENSVWRSFIRVAIILPRVLEEDLGRTGGLSLTEYSVLMSLSEAPDRELRMSELANRTALSASRITRIVADLEQYGLVAKRRSSSDLRGNVAVLTNAGMAKVRATWPDHLASVRARFIDHLTDDEAALLGPVFERVAIALDANTPAPPKADVKRRRRQSPAPRRSAG